MNRWAIFFRPAGWATAILLLSLADCLKRSGCPTDARYSTSLLRLSRACRDRRADLRFRREHDFCQ